MATNEKGTKTVNSEEEELDTVEVEEEVKDPENSPSSETENKIDDEAFNKAVSEKVEETIKGRVGREIEKTNELKKQLEELNEKFIKVSEELKKTGTELQGALQNNVMFQVALEEGIEVEVVKSLKGETYDEIKEAVKVVKAVSHSNTPDIFTGKEHGSGVIQLDHDRMLKNMKM